MPPIQLAKGKRCKRQFQEGNYRRHFSFMGSLEANCICFNQDINLLLPQHGGPGYFRLPYSQVSLKFHLILNKL